MKRHEVSCIDLPMKRFSPLAFSFFPRCSNYADSYWLVVCYSGDRGGLPENARLFARVGRGASCERFWLRKDTSSVAPRRYLFETSAVGP